VFAQSGFSVHAASFGGVEPFAQSKAELVVLGYRDSWISTLCAEKLYEISQLCQRLLKACLRPSDAGHYLSLVTVPNIARCTVFQVLVLHIPEGNLFAFE
jgi:hypothetical protein